MKIDIIASGSSGNCYKISNEDTTLLIECGIPYKNIQEALDFKTASIDGVLVSHEHMDHAKACKDLIKAGVDLYMTKGTKKALDLESHRVKTFEESNYSTYRWVEIGSFKIKAFETVHDAKEPVGFYILNTKTDERLLFITDTMFVKNRFRTIDYLMLEVNYDKKTINDNPGLNDELRERIKKNHMSLETAVDFLDKCGLVRLKKIYVMHLSDSNSDAKFIKESLQEVAGVSVEIC